ncbi:BtrH N-terminal domain-containing protein [Effusibacillus dendaii]|uniref:Peptidase n=1 Tax=Effusibacillus dendaii TaxID=2743772 RepID=A0A7I8DC97_9BACL|nr:BtrH N-terminal domain-containing protein [Effusibacillus dendaii]BCJ86140.1 hypothetical protein skT53_11250 [Effusibacillus dendaii]
MRHIVNDFIHQAGVHCGSTALADVMRYNGFSLSEPICFGLACGLDFLYIESDTASPSRFFNGRTHTMEPVLFQNIGMDIHWQSGDEFPAAAIKQNLDKNIPVLALTDLHYLEYYNTKTHFSLHGIVIAGYDDERRVFFVADTERDGLQETSYDNLAHAMDSKEGSVPLANHWMAIEQIPAFDLVVSMQKAIVMNAKRMLQPPDQTSGLPALRSFASRMEKWDQLPDWKWVARFGYQVIEKRGTGGGAFRKMYATFLQEAEQLLKNESFRQLQPSVKMNQLSLKWTDLAMVLKEISESDQPDFTPAVSIAREIADSEQLFFENIELAFRA